MILTHYLTTRVFTRIQRYLCAQQSQHPNYQAFRKKVHASRSQGWCMILETKRISNMIAAQDKNVGDANLPIFIYGDFTAESATHLNNNKEIKLPEGAVLLSKMETCTISPGNDSFRHEVYMQKLYTLLFGKCLLWSPCLPSTHTFLSENFCLFPVGTVCIADVQLSGKGRAGNKWESPNGCLMFSFTLTMDNGRLLPFLQYVVSIALLDAIEHISLEKCLPNLPIKIKWPNDIYANGVKIGGVLSTSTYRERKFNVVIGIGLNIGNQKPTTCLNALMQDIVPGAPPFEREEFLAVFFGKFERLFDAFVKEGFAPLEESYYRKWLHSGQVVTLEEIQANGTMKRIPLTIQGLSPTGYLLGVDDENETYELHPDGNSLDFFKGLLRSKLRP